MREIRLRIRFSPFLLPLPILRTDGLRALVSLLADILFIKQTHDLLKQMEPCSTDSAKWLHVENNPDFSRQRLGTERIPMFSAL